MLIVFSVLAICENSVSAARWRSIEVYNNTGYTIYSLYVTAREQRNWGKDLLGNSKLYNGGHTSFSYDADYQYYEIKVVLNDGTEKTWTDDAALNFYNSTMLIFTSGRDGRFNARVD